MDQVQPTGRIDVISDVICPWCYIGKRQPERALDLLAAHHCRVAVAWHPFQLNPEMPTEGVERTSYRISKFGSLERSRQLDQRITETAATRKGNAGPSPESPGAQCLGVEEFRFGFAPRAMPPAEVTLCEMGRRFLAPPSVVVGAGGPLHPTTLP